MTVASLHSSRLVALSAGPLVAAGLGPFCPVDRPPPPNPLWRPPLRAICLQKMLAPPTPSGGSPSVDVDQAPPGSKGAAFFTKTRPRP